jgi:hypothetical protein
MLPFLDELLIAVGGEVLKFFNAMIFPFPFEFFLVINY